MYRASLGDLEEPCALILRYVSAELEAPLDAVYVSLRQAAVASRSA